MLVLAAGQIKYLLLVKLQSGPDHHRGLGEHREGEQDQPGDSREEHSGQDKQLQQPVLTAGRVQSSARGEAGRLTWCVQVSQEVRLLLKRIKENTPSQLTEL